MQDGSVVDTIFWFRRDLRLDDNTALTKALMAGKNVQPIFIFDTKILESLPKADRRISFLHSRLNDLNESLRKFESSLRIYHGEPKEVFRKVKSDFASVSSAYWNRDYTPYASSRDSEVKAILQSKGIANHTYKDHVVLEPQEVLKADNTPYSVFTPYSNKWRQVVSHSDLESYSIQGFEINFAQSNYVAPSLLSLGFDEEQQDYISEYPSEELLTNYAENRDFPASNGTSKVSLALRFGTLSIRELFRRSKELSTTYATELIWREFYQMIIWHFPQTVTQEFKPKYAAIPWRRNETDFNRWKNGTTGIPLVDAGMRELNKTGFMHNRVRMVVASFLCKNLLIDWRWGEAYFAEKLLDYELASNVGGWQWAASCGCDASPYFRIFNPEAQAKKFDPNSEYIRRWVPEFETRDYTPMVDVKQTRKDCIEIFKHTLSQAI